MSFVIAVQSIALSVMIVLSIVGNIGVCWVTYNTRNTEPITAMLMMNMAATDLLRGVIDMPFALITLVSGDVDHWLLGDSVCQMTAFVSQTLCLASTLSVACVSIDRYCTIVYAFDYQTMMTQRRAKVMLVLTWLAAAIISLLPVLGVGLYRFLPATHHCTSDWTNSPAYSLSVLSAGFLLPLAITSVCNFRIFRAARSQSRRVDELSSRGGDGTGGGDRFWQRVPRRVWRPPRHRAHAAKIILVVFGTFFCCWTVYVTAHIWNVIRYESEAVASWSKDRAPSKDPYDLNSWWITLATFVAFANAVVSPYVYTLLNRRMRKTLRKLLIRLCCPAGRVDYRRSTIVFATNVNSRWRSTRQRGWLGARQSEEFHTSEMVQRGSVCRSIREDAGSFISAPLHFTNPTDSSYNASCSGTSSSTPPARRRGPVPQLTYNLEGIDRTKRLPPVKQGATLPPLWCRAQKTFREAPGDLRDNQCIRRGTYSPQSTSEDDGTSSSNQPWVIQEGDDGCTPRCQWPRGTGRLLTPLGFSPSTQTPEPPFRLPDCHLLGADLTTTHKKSLRPGSGNVSFETTKVFQVRPSPIHQRTGKGSQKGKAKDTRTQTREECISMKTLTHTENRNENKVRFKVPTERRNDLYSFADEQARQNEKGRRLARRRRSWSTSGDSSREGSASSQEIMTSSLDHASPSTTALQQRTEPKPAVNTLPKMAWCRPLSAGSMSKGNDQRSASGTKKRKRAPTTRQTKM